VPDEGHPVLTRISPARARLAVGGLLTVTLAALGLAGAPAATAGRTAFAQGIPAGAQNQLGSEMTAAWQISTGQGVTIALLDTAVDPVSDLAGRLTAGPDFAPVPGSSAADGTVIASLIAGSGPTAGNAFGGVGRAPGARILSEQIWDPQDTSSQEQHDESANVWPGVVAEAIRYAVNHGASVIVDTESGTDMSVSLESAVAYAVSKNVVVIGGSAAYTGDQQAFSYPDSLPGVINFSGTTLSGLQPPNNSELYPVNDSVLVTTPDNTMDTTGPGNQPYAAWGYDAAVAWVAGTVALIKSVYPQITPAMVISALALSASYPPAGGYNTTIGFGLINPLGALHEAASLMKQHASAAPGPTALAGTARFSKVSPGVIHAVRHSIVKLVGYSAAIVIGVALLVLAAALLRRRRRRGAGPVSLVAVGPPLDPPLDPTLDTQVDTPGG
jgi:Subtilase family